MNGGVDRQLIGASVLVPTAKRRFTTYFDKELGEMRRIQQVGMVTLTVLLGLMVLVTSVSAESPLTLDQLDLPEPAADLGQSGPFQPGWRSVNIPGGTAKLYYPASASGQNAPYDGSAAPYPAIAYGHGFLQHPDMYQGTLEHLATHGYFVIAPETELDLFPSHADFAADLNNSLTYLVNANSDGGSWLLGQVATDALGLSGHSMGGGASILAAANNPAVKAVVNMAPAETNPSAISAMPLVGAPIALLAGSQDGITPPSQHQQPMYNNGVAPRLLPLIEGGFHCGFQSTASLFCDSGSISRQQQLTITHRWTTAFFNLYLKGDMSAWQLVWGYQMLLDGGVTTQFDAGVMVNTPVQSGSGAAGSAVVYQLVVTNSTNAPMTLNGVYESTRGWSATFSATGGTLPAGQSVPVTITVSIPPGTAPGVRDTGLIKILNAADGLTGAFSAVRTTAAP
jgi:dienelactone hydrolase